MKALVVYDSVHGNTEKVARAVAEVLGKSAKVRVVRPREVTSTELGAADLLVVGSPTLGGRPTPGIKAMLDGLESGSLRDVAVSAFDTRMDMFVARLFGYAADKIASVLQQKGGRAAAAPHGAIVLGSEGPLKQGELERTADWASGISSGAR